MKVSVGDETGATCETHGVYVLHLCVPVPAVGAVFPEGIDGVVLLHDGDDDAVVPEHIGGIGKDVCTCVLVHENGIRLHDTSIGLVAPPGFSQNLIVPVVSWLPPAHHTAVPVSTVHDLEPEDGPLIEIVHGGEEGGGENRVVAQFVRVIGNNLRDCKVWPVLPVGIGSILIDTIVDGLGGRVVVGFDAICGDVVAGPVGFWLGAAGPLVEPVLVGHPGLEEYVVRRDLMCSEVTLHRIVAAGHGDLICHRGISEDHYRIEATP